MKTLNDMGRQFKLKVYLPKSVEVVSLPREMFQTKVMKVNAEVAKVFMADKYPDWRRAVLVMTSGPESHRMTQRMLIERR